MVIDEPSGRIAEILDPHSEWRISIENLLGQYQMLYHLPFLENKEEISSSFFNYCLRGRYFVVIALYNSQRNFFIQRDFSKRNEHWELVGGWLNEGESFDQALDRIVARETGNILVEALPIARVKNCFFTKDSKQIYHSGAAYLGRLRKDETSSQNGVFTKSSECKLSERDMKILNLGETLLNKKVVEPPLEEVDSGLQRSIGHWVHKFFVRPAFYWGSSRILQKEIFAEAIAVGENQTRTIFDVACGDDKTILRLAERANLVVANDISRQSMFSLIGTRRRENIIFTNQNVLELDVKTIFDVVICKNVMHHMKNADEVERLFSVLRKLGKRILVMDVENPHGSILSRIWNKYYTLFLRDHGGFFMNFHQFNEIIKIFYHSAKNVSCKKISTIKGTYMCAVIDQ